MRRLAMTNAETDSLPVACDLHVFDPVSRARHRALLSDVVKARHVGVHDLPDGIELVYPVDRGLVAALATWIVDERRCCPFLTFELEVGPGDPRLRLRLRGPEGTRELLMHELTG